MRYVLQGALGAALFYPLIWYASVPEPVEIVTSPAIAHRPVAVHDGEPSEAEPGPGRAPRTERGTPRTTEVSRRIDSVPQSAAAAAVAEAPLPPRAPTRPSVALPSVPQPIQPTAASPLPPGLPELLSRVSDVQQSAGNPTELAERVQTLDADPMELAHLKAFADQFVRLPPSAAERYVGGSEGSVAPPASTAPRR